MELSESTESVQMLNGIASRCHSSATLRTHKSNFSNFGNLHLDKKNTPTHHRLQKDSSVALKIFQNRALKTSLSSRTNNAFRISSQQLKKAKYEQQLACSQGKYHKEKSKAKSKKPLHLNSCLLNKQPVKHVKNVSLLEQNTSIIHGFNTQSLERTKKSQTYRKNEPNGLFSPENKFGNSYGSFVGRLNEFWQQHSAKKTQTSRLPLRGSKNYFYHHQRYRTNVDQIIPSKKSDLSMSDSSLGIVGQKAPYKQMQDHFRLKSSLAKKKSKMQKRALVCCHNLYFMVNDRKSSGRGSTLEL